MAALVFIWVLCVALFFYMPNDSKSEIGGSLGGLLKNPPMLVLHFAQVLGAPWGYASEWRGASESAALRLVCGAEDEESLQLLFHNREESRGIVERLAPTYRRLGLDMFSWPGAQWVGETMPESIIAGEAIQGRWKIDKQMGKSIRGEATARFSGWALTSKGGQPVDYVLVYQGSRRIVGLGRMTVRRADLNEKFGLHPEAVVGFQGTSETIRKAGTTSVARRSMANWSVRSWRGAVAEVRC